MTRARTRGVLLSLAAFAVTGHASAQARGGSAEAEELFKQGRAALEAKDYSAACPKLAASLQLERAVGTLISLAVCEQSTGKLAAARQHWQEAADFADATHDRLDRAPFARAKFQELDPRVPRLTIRLAPGAPKDAALQRDEVSLGGAAFDAPLPVDPGPHRVTVTAPGHESRSLRIELAEGERRTLTVDVGPATTAPTSPVAPAQRADLATSASSGGDGRRIAAYVAAGVGVVGLGLGTVFGVDAMSKWSQARSDCGSGCATGSTARAEQSSASTDATLSTVTFAVGGVALGAAAYLYFTAPSPSPSSGSLRWEPGVGPGAASLRVVGTF